MPSLLVSCYELKDLFKNFSRKGRWGTEESKSRHLFDLKVVDGKKQTNQHKTSPHGLDLERIWGSAQTHCSQMRKLRPRAGVWVEVQQSLEPLHRGPLLSPPFPASPLGPSPASFTFEVLRWEFLGHPVPSGPRPSTLGSSPGATCHVVQHMVLRSDW